MFSGKSEISDTEGKKCNNIFASRLSNALFHCTIMRALLHVRFMLFWCVCPKFIIMKSCQIS